MTGGSQKFIARNRAPRVQIEYDIELYGAEKKVQLPFVMGVMSDLVGKSKVAQPTVENRKFLEIDVDSFDDRMRAMQPRAAFSVPNTLTGEGNLAIDLTFEKMADFTPQAIAAKIEPLRELLRARTELSNLATYMDGKVGAETLIERILRDPALLRSVSAMAAAEDRTEATLDALRDAAPDDGPEADGTAATLDALRDAAPQDAAETDGTGAALATLRAAVPEEIAEKDATDSALDGLRGMSPAETANGDGTAAALEALREAAPTETVQADPTGAALDALRDAAPEQTAEADPAADTLDALRDAVPEDVAEEDRTGAALDALRGSAVDVPETGDHGQAALEGLRNTEVPTPDPEDPTQAALDDLRAAPAPETGPDETAGAALQGLRDAAPAEPDSEDAGQDVLAALAQMPAAQAEPDSGAEDVLQGLRRDAPDETPETDAARAALDSLTAPQDAPPDSPAAPADDDPPDTPDDPAAADPLAVLDTEPEDVSDDLDDLLGDAAPAPPADAGSSGLDDLDDLLGDAPTTDPLADLDTERSGVSDDLDDLLGDAEAEPDEAAPAAPEALDDLLGDAVPEAAEATPSAADDLDDLLKASDDPAADPLADLDTEPEDAFDASDDLDDLLGDAPPSAEPVATVNPEETGSDDLDDLLADLDGGSGGDAPADEAAQDSPASDPEPGDDLDDLLGDLTDQASPGDAPTGAAPSGGAGMDFAFGLITGERPDARRLNRTRFRLALLGDFSGRAARGLIETGDALAVRPAIPLDPDTVDDVIAGFATTLVLPIGKDGAGVEIALGELDDLHPDELYEKVALFSELAGLRGQLAGGATADHAAKTLRAWGETHGTPVAPARRRSAGNTVPADRRLSEFQKLIGDTSASLTQPAPLEDLLARIVGPHIRAVPDADAVAMQAAVDQALSAAMRLVLHDPEFQSLEAQWRSLDLIARSIEVDDTLEVVLYDISAEEIAADLAGAADLAQSGFARLLTEQPLDEETGRGGYSALIGFYAFEETPPHAELLGRIGRVAAHVDAPFVAALSPAFLETPKEDRHPLVAQAWDRLRAMPEAGHLGLVSPRFLLRRPYGAKSEPAYAFDFEEFTMADGLSGMLWANPAVLAAILLAKSYRENGAGMGLGSVMSLGGMPYHFVTDGYGDQVALPCTERNLTLDKVEQAMARGLMPVVSIKGRDEIRLASFQSLAGGDILGPWSDVPPPPPSPPEPAPAADGGAEADDLGLDDLLAGFEDDGAARDGAGDGDDIDADLAALLEDL